LQRRHEKQPQGVLADVAQHGHELVHVDEGEGPGEGVDATAAAPERGAAAESSW
jgi:hypothetical protein